MSVAYPQLNVKVVGSHAGVSIGEDGASQMGIEDVSLMCSLPHFVVVVPADEESAKGLTKAILTHVGPAYLRAGRPEVPKIYKDGDTFTIGKAIQLMDGADVTLIANGLMVAPCLDAAEALESSGIKARVLDMHTVKPIDRDALLAAAKDTGALVVAEEHLAHGGLGSCVAMAVAELHPVPIRYVNIGDQFGESGTPDELLVKFGMTADKVIEAAKAVVAAKKS